MWVGWMKWDCCRSGFFWHNINGEDYLELIDGKVALVLWRSLRQKKWPVLTNLVGTGWCTSAQKENSYRSLDRAIWKSHYCVESCHGIATKIAWPHSTWLLSQGLFKKQDFSNTARKSWWARASNLVWDGYPKSRESTGKTCCFWNATKGAHWFTAKWRTCWGQRYINFFINL